MATGLIILKAGVISNLHEGLYRVRRNERVLTLGMQIWDAKVRPFKALISALMTHSTLIH